MNMGGLTSLATKKARIAARSPMAAVVHSPVAIANRAKPAEVLARPTSAGWGLVRPKIVKHKASLADKPTMVAAIFSTAGLVISAPHHAHKATLANKASASKATPTTSSSKPKPTISVEVCY